MTMLEGERLALLKRRCCICGETKTWHAFTPRRYHPDGTVASVQGRCKPCRAALRREWEARNPERTREGKRRSDKLRRTRPEVQAAERIYHREWRRRKRGTPPERYRNSPYIERERAGHVDGRGWRLPRQPFAAWLEHKIEQLGGPAAVCEATGLHDRHLRRILSGEDGENVNIDTVDKALTNEGSTMLDDIYGEAGR